MGNGESGVGSEEGREEWIGRVWIPVGGVTLARKRDVGGAEI